MSRLRIWCTVCIYTFGTVLTFQALGAWFKRPATLFFFTLSGCFFCLGLVLGGLGPIVLELGRRTDTPVESVGLFVSARGIGYVLGTLTGGPMMDCGVPGNILLALSVTASALSTCFITLAYNFWVSASLLFFQGVSMGVLDSGGNVQLLWMFKDQNVNPYMQCLHFFFAFGSTVSPLIVGRVMDEFNDNFNYAYYALGGSYIPLIFVLFFQPAAKNPEDENPEPEDPEISDGRRAANKLLKMFCYFTGDERWMIWWVSVFLGIYVGAEVATGSLIYTYVVKRAIGTEQDGYLMTFVFWALIALGRLTAVPLSLVLSGLQMLFINLVGCIAAPAVILFFPDSLPVLWGAVGFYGFFMASSFPTAFVVAESMIMISGSIASLFVVGSGMGEIIIPTAVTELFGTSLSYFSLIYTMLFCACMGLLCWFGMLWRYKSMEKRGVLPFQMEQVKREKGEGEGGGAGEEGGRNGRKYEYRDEESVLLDASKA